MELLRRPADIEAVHRSNGLTEWQCSSQRMAWAKEGRSAAADRPISNVSVIYIKAAGAIVSKQSRYLEDDDLLPDLQSA